MTPKDSFLSSPKRTAGMATPTVEQCLKEAGLDAERLLPKLEQAGFDTIEALSELKAEFFPALDVTESSDRRKLFLLVHSLVKRRQKRYSQEPSLEADQEASPVRSALTRQRSNSGDSLDSKIPVPSPSRGGRRPNGANDISLVALPGENEKMSGETDDAAEKRIEYGVGDDRSESDDFVDAVQGGEEQYQTSAPCRSRRLQEKSISKSRVAPQPPSGTAAPLHSTTATNRRFSRLSTPIKRSKEINLTNFKTQPLNSRLLPPMEPEKVIKSAPSHESAGSVASEIPQKNSFQSQIEALRIQNADDHNMFHQFEPETPEMAGSMRIRVVVRKRPMSTTEIALAGNADILHPLDFQSFGKMLVYQPRTRVDLTKEIETIPFAFDNVFDEKANNAQIYERAVRPLIPGLFEKQWATLFAYGQTGSGKTYTTLGSVHTTGVRNCCYGLYFLAAMDIFQYLRTRPDLHVQVRVSLFEIYSGNLYDLFNGRQVVKCLEDAKGKINFKGLSERSLQSAHDLMPWIHEASAFRSTGTTSRNADSSRSHAVLQLHLYRNSNKSEFSRMTFIDLAGSERGADTYQACRTTRQEGADINTSLLSLKEVIRALARGKEESSHVPFRGSKLTQVLKESFVGKSCRSVMIACVSPNIGNCDQTLNTLRYANRVKERDPKNGGCANDAVVAGPIASRLQAGPRVSVGIHDAVTGKPSVRRVQADQDDTETRVLDELLASNCSLRRQTSLASSDKVPTQLSTSFENPLKLAEGLVESHKTMMTEVLHMISDEMELCGSLEIENIEYFRACEILHSRQLQIVQKLREEIETYRRARSAVGSATAMDVLEDDDDSVEDLRGVV